MSRLIDTTALKAMRPTGTDAERSPARLKAVLTQEFGDTLDIHYAEPVKQSGAGAIDWYVASDEPMTRLSDMAAPDAARHRTRLDAAFGRIAEAVERHRGQGGDAGRGKADALTVAMTYPGDANVWIEGDPGRADAPIHVTGWGYEPHDAEAITRPAHLDTGPRQTGQTPPPPPVAPMVLAAAPEPRSWRSRLMWIGLFVLPILLAIGIAWLLLPACGVRLPFSTITFGWGGGVHCGHDTTNLAEEDDRSRRLRLEVEALEDQIRRRRLACVPETPADPCEGFARVPATLDAPTQISLLWDGPADLDLYIVCPDDTIISHRDPAACGGRHDRDSNPPGGPMTEQPFEDVAWANPPRAGSYKVRVRLFDRQGATEPRIPFKVRIRRDGQETCLDGEVWLDMHQKQVFEFEVGA